MAIVWVDGFDHYAVANASRKYTSLAGAGMGSMTTARYGSGQAISMCNAVQGFTKAFSSSSQAWRFGFAYQLTSMGSEATVMALQNGSTAQVDLRITNMQKLRVTRNGTQLGVTSKGLHQSVWYYVEWWIVISNSTSSNYCVLKVNGEEWLNLDVGADTQNDSVSTADRFVVNGNTSTTQIMDDLVVWQETPTSSPTFYGDLRVVTLYPDGTGGYGTSFLGSDNNTTNNYLLVDETLVDDTDFVRGDTVSGPKDSYTFGNPTATPASVPAIQLTMNARKDDIGNRSGQLFLRISSTDYESSATQLTTSYACYTNVWETNPNTSAAWSSANLTALEGGVVAS